MDLVGRVRGILLDPKAEWHVIEREAADTAALLKGYVAILAAIPAVLIPTVLIWMLGLYLAGRCEVAELLALSFADDQIQANRLGPAHPGRVISSETGRLPNSSVDASLSQKSLRPGQTGGVRPGRGIRRRAS